MTEVLAPHNVGDLWMLLRDRLQQPGYEDRYEAEPQFEVAVWTRVVALAQDLGLEPASVCLTSHSIHADRSAEAWDKFCKDEAGPDVNVLGSNNRLDIVFKHPTHGSIGIEVKWLGETGHAGKLTQALGQALLGLAHRDRTLVVIHCGTVDARERERLRRTADKICAGVNTAVVVAP